MESLLSLFCHKRPEQIAHGHYFVKSKGSDWLTVSLLYRATRGNRSQFPNNMSDFVRKSEEQRAKEQREKKRSAKEQRANDPKSEEQNSEEQKSEFSTLVFRCCKGADVDYLFHRDS